MNRPSQTTLIALIGGGLFLLLLIWMFAGIGGGDQDKLGDNQTAAAAATDPEKRCAAKSTYDLIKRELFRRAAQLRGSDQPAFDKLAAYATLRMERPVLESENGDSGAISCTGALSLDLPPGVAVVGGRRTLTADIDYGLQAAADGSGEVLTLANAEAIVTPLATLARTGQPASAGLAPEVASDPMVAEPLSVPPAPPPPPLPARPADVVEAPSARPSFNCANARTRSEIAVCGNANLAALDRQMAAQFGGALRSAGPSERALLDQTRGRFLSYRDGCRSDDCIADSYRGRMTEIRDIMAGRWVAPR